MPDPPRKINSEKQKINAKEPKNYFAEDHTLLPELQIDSNRTKANFQRKNWWDPLIYTQGAGEQEIRLDPNPPAPLVLNWRIPPRPILILFPPR